MSVPPISPLPPAPQITDAPGVFNEKANDFVAALEGLPGEANALGDFVEDRAGDAEAAKTGAEAARDEAETARDAALAAPSLVNYQGVWEAGTYDAGQSVFHEPTGLFYISDDDGNTAEPPGGDWREVGTAEKIAYDNTTSGLTATDVQDALDEVFSPYNILGAVSQSGGVPTGAIIERGSNANGEFVRYADGTQICWRETAINLGGLTSGAARFQDRSMPISFDTNLTEIAGSITSNSRGPDVDSRETFAQFTYFVAEKDRWTYHPVSKSGSPSSSFPVTLLAIGRWY